MERHAHGARHSLFPTPIPRGLDNALLLRERSLAPGRRHRLKPIVLRPGRLIMRVVGPSLWRRDPLDDSDHGAGTDSQMPCLRRRLCAPLHRSRAVDPSRSCSPMASHCDERSPALRPASSKGPANCRLSAPAGRLADPMNQLFEGKSLELIFLQSQSGQPPIQCLS